MNEAPNLFVIQAQDNGAILFMVPDDDSESSRTAILALARVEARIAYVDRDNLARKSAMSWPYSAAQRILREVTQ